jgi:plastocyanin
MSTQKNLPAAEAASELRTESSATPIPARRAPRWAPGVGAVVVAIGALIVGVTLAFALGQGGSGNTNNAPVSSATGTSNSAQRATPAAVVMIGSAPGTDSTAAGSFVPTSVAIRVGQTVEWVWRDSSVPQNVTFDAGFHSATQTSGTYFHTFATPGVFPYISTIHFDMSGEVIVR